MRILRNLLFDDLLDNASLPIKARIPHLVETSVQNANRVDERLAPSCDFVNDKRIG